MRKKILKQLVTASYRGSLLDQEQVADIARHLNRQELKEYIKALKGVEKQKQLRVESSFVPTTKQEAFLREQFPDKDIIFELNPELIFGMKITNNDIVYDINLRRTLDAIEDYIEQQYD